MVRLAASLGLVRRDSQTGNVENVTWLMDLAKAFQCAHGLSFGLREVAAEATAIGIARLTIAKAFLVSVPDSSGWIGEEVWPFFLENMDIFEGIFGVRPMLPELQMCNYDWLKKSALLILALMPEPPYSLRKVLWKIAFDWSNSDREKVQKCFGKVPGIKTRIIAELSSRNTSNRYCAAQWLADQGDRVAVEPLKTAARIEQHEATKTVMLDALDTFDVSANGCLDRSWLANEAQEGINVPGALDNLAWFPFHRLPKTRWADDMQLVDQEILIWLIVRAYQRKTPEPNAILRACASQLVPEDAHAMGRFVLEAWIAIDTAAGKPVDARTPARRVGFDAGELRYRDNAARHYRGVLSVAAAMIGEDAVPLATKHLSMLGDNAADECEPLQMMLACVEHSGASRLIVQTAVEHVRIGIAMLSLGAFRRFHRRHGWSRHEAADLLTPTAGLDARGFATCSFGDLSVWARIDNKLDLAIVARGGEDVTRLLQQSGEADWAVADGIERWHFQARRWVKAVVKEQRVRLYHAMCTQRWWRFADWQELLAKHPVVGAICKKVIWMTTLDKGAAEHFKTFRLVDDGTLRDADGKIVEVAEDRQVSVAHRMFISDWDATAWKRRLAKEEVGLIFDQFDRKAYRVPEGRESDTSLMDFKGHVVNVGKLHRRAIRLGYNREVGTDGEWGGFYKRDFVTIDLTVRIKYSGSRDYEKNRNVAIYSAHFLKWGVDVLMEREVSVSEVPAVLVSECWNDLREIAGEGTGFNPDWASVVSH